MTSIYKSSSWLVLCIPVLLAHEARADDPKPPDAPAPVLAPEAAAQEASRAAAVKTLQDKKAVKENDADVATARPQLVAIRGGSLGFAPPSNNQGVLAGVDVKGTSLNSKSGADAFAKVGGVALDDGARVTGEVNGESFEEDVPQVSLTAVSPKPTMTPTTFASVGLRARWNVHPTVWATHKISVDCIEHPERTRDAAATKVCTNDREAVTETAVWSLMAGIRLVRRGNADEGLTDLSGMQWELGFRRDSEAQVESRFSWSILGGLSGMHVNRSEITDSTGMATTRYLQMNDVRLSIAAEIRAAATKDVAHSAAIGIYSVASWNAWTNTFAEADASKVRDHQLEGGVYVSGAMTGFSGLVKLSIIQPYTPGAPYVYAVSVMPFGGGVPTPGPSS